VRNRVSETLAVSRILDHRLGPDPEPSDDDLRRFQEEHIEDYQTPEEVRAWHIYLEPETPEDTYRLYTLLRKARKELLAGADFEAKAREICRPDHHLDLGFYRQGSMVREAEIVTFSMEVGEISPIVSTHFGLHIFKLVDRKVPEPLPFEGIRNDLSARYLAVWRDRRIQEIVADLRSKASISAPVLETTAHEHA
jgi:parvulin-like peptidyl-prolyl isomerase